MKKIIQGTVERLQENLKKYVKKVGTENPEQKKAILEIKRLFEVTIEENGFNLCKSKKNKDIIDECFKKIKKCQLDIKINFDSVLRKLGNIKEIASIKTFHSSIKPPKYDDSVKNIKSFGNITNIPFEEIVNATIFYVYNLAYCEYNFLRTVVVLDKDIKVLDENKGQKLEIIDKNIKLFPQGEPKYDEVIQGNIGDCYLLAALSELATTEEGTKAIKDCFVNEETFQEDFFVSIRLYKVTRETVKNKEAIFKKQYASRWRHIVTPGLKVIIKVEKSIANFGAKGEAVWVKLFEKAYAVYRKGNNFLYDETLTDVKYSDLKGGYEKMIMAAILNESSASRSFTDVGSFREAKVAENNAKNAEDEVEKAENAKDKAKKVKDAEDKVKKAKDAEDKAKKDGPDELYERIKRNIANKIPMTVSDNADKNSEADEELGLYSSHAYTVIGAEEEKFGEEMVKVVTLRNPHASVSSGYSPDSSSGKYTFQVLKSEPKKGIIKLTLEDFMEHFDSIDYVRKKYNLSDITSKGVSCPEIENMCNNMKEDFNEIKGYQKTLNKIKKALSLEVVGKVGFYKKKLENCSAIKSECIEESIKSILAFSKFNDPENDTPESVNFTEKVEITRYFLSQIKKFHEKSKELGKKDIKQCKTDADKSKEFVNQAENLVTEQEKSRDRILRDLDELVAKIESQEQIYNDFVLKAKGLYVFDTSGSIKCKDAFTDAVKSKYINEPSTCCEIMQNDYNIKSQFKSGGAKYAIINTQGEKVYPEKDSALMSKKEMQKFLKDAANKLEFDLPDITSQSDSFSEIENMCDDMKEDFNKIEDYQKALNKIKKTISPEIVDKKIDFCNKTLKNCNAIKSKCIKDSIKSILTFSELNDIAEFNDTVTENLETIRHFSSQIQELLEKSKDLGGNDIKQCETDADKSKEFVNQAENLVTELKNSRDRILRDLGMLVAKIKSQEQIYNDFVSEANGLYVFDANGLIECKDAFTNAVQSKYINKPSTCFEIMQNGYDIKPQYKHLMFSGMFKSGGAKYAIINARGKKVYPEKGSALMSKEETQKFLKDAADKLKFDPDSDLALELPDITSQDVSCPKIKIMRNDMVKNFKKIEGCQKDLNEIKKTLSSEIVDKVGSCDKMLKNCNTIKSECIEEQLKSISTFSESNDTVTEKLETIRSFLSQIKEFLEKSKDFGENDIEQCRTDTDESKEFVKQAENLVTELENSKDRILHDLDELVAKIESQEQIYNDFVSEANGLYVFDANGLIECKNAFTDAVQSKYVNKPSTCLEIIQNGYDIKPQYKHLMFSGMFKSGGAKYAIINAQGEKVYPKKDSALMSKEETQKFLKDAADKLKFDFS
ncbi:hypothetical protein FACS189465_1250 [Clostridia bacterium]|nr:hypothetical protein FACS189465_1250 [Clostridia bacterium]